MTDMTAEFGNIHLAVVATADALAARCAETIASAIDLALAERDRAQIALAGGETPRASYLRLGQEHLPWERVDVLLGDERWVPEQDLASNARMMRETLLAQPPGRAARLHPVPTDLPTPAEARDCPASPSRRLSSRRRVRWSFWSAALASVRHCSGCWIRRSQRIARLRALCSPARESACWPMRPPPPVWACDRGFIGVRYHPSADRGWYRLQRLDHPQRHDHGRSQLRDLHSRPRWLADGVGGG